MDDAARKARACKAQLLLVQVFVLSCDYYLHRESMEAFFPKHSDTDLKQQRMTFINFPFYIFPELNKRKKSLLHLKLAT